MKPDTEATNAAFSVAVAKLKELTGKDWAVVMLVAPVGVDHPDVVGVTNVNDEHTTQVLWSGMIGSRELDG